MRRRPNWLQPGRHTSYRPWSPYEAQAQHAAGAGYSAEMLRKLEMVRDSGLRSLEICRSAGVKMGFGTDIIGDQELHTQEFMLRAQVLPAHEIIASATRIGAEILRREGVLGVIAPDAIADLLIVDGNPLRDISVLAGPRRASARDNERWSVS